MAEPRELLEKARSRAEKTLTEYESKRLLEAYGIPVIQDLVVRNAVEAVAAAERIGFPVVLKGLGVRLTHKTERSLVCLNLKDAESVREATRSVRTLAGADLEGLLIGPQIPGRREFMAGLYQDPQFGPVVMVGAGGVFAEILSDVALRLVPLKDTDAEEMLGELRAASLLNEFRGERPADRNALGKTLAGLSRLAEDFPEIAEIDINPLIVSPDGAVRAVDALVVLGERGALIQKAVPIPPAALNDFFHPESIAFVGASAELGKWGHMLFTLTAGGGFGGDIFLVNPRGGKIAGRPVYRTVLDIPDRVDLAVVTVPAGRVMDLLPEFREKGIRNMLLVTSGFGETGTSGKRLEARLVAEARDSGILILGPNTMGICNPHVNLYCTGSHVRPRPGSTAVVSQSGNMGTQLLAFAEQQGIGIRGFCGSGNEAMVTVEDFLEGFEKDPLTRVVMLYVESVKDGRRFYESACRVAQKKPIVLLKGGRSSAGNRAAASHTGALSSDSRVFDAVCRQAGIIQVDQPMDLLDLAAAFSSVPVPRGNRTAIMTLGGGWGVVTADLCSDHGLEVPELSREIIERLDRILPPYWSRGNPVDIVGERDPSIPLVAIEELLKWEGCDAVINLGIVGRRHLLDRLIGSVQKVDPTYSRDLLDEAGRRFAEFEENYIRHIVNLMDTYGKPIYGVRLITGEGDQTVNRIDGAGFKGIFYKTPERAVKALSKMVAYACFLDRDKERI